MMMNKQVGQEAIEEEGYHHPHQHDHQHEHQSNNTNGNDNNNNNNNSDGWWWLDNNNHHNNISYDANDDQRTMMMIPSEIDPLLMTSFVSSSTTTDPLNNNNNSRYVPNYERIEQRNRKARIIVTFLLGLFVIVSIGSMIIWNIKISKYKQKQYNIVSGEHGLSKLNKDISYLSTKITEGCTSTLLFMRQCENYGPTVTKTHIVVSTGSSSTPYNTSIGSTNENDNNNSSSVSSSLTKKNLLVLHCNYVGNERAEHLMTLFHNNTTMTTTIHKNDTTSTSTMINSNENTAWSYPSYVFAYYDINTVVHENNNKNKKNNNIDDNNNDSTNNNNQSPKEYAINLQYWETVQPLSQRIGINTQIILSSSNNNNKDEYYDGRRRRNNKYDDNHNNNNNNNNNNPTNRTQYFTRSEFIQHYTELLRSGTMCNKVTIVSLNRKDIPIVASKLGCGSHDGCTEIFGTNENDYDTIWEIQYTFHGIPTPTTTATVTDSNSENGYMYNTNNNNNNSNNNSTIVQDNTVIRTGTTSKKSKLSLNNTNITNTTVSLTNVTSRNTTTSVIATKIKKYGWNVQNTIKKQNFDPLSFSKSVGDYPNNNNNNNNNNNINSNNINNEVGNNIADSEDRDGIKKGGRWQKSSAYYYKYPTTIIDDKKKTNLIIAVKGKQNK